MTDTAQYEMDRAAEDYPIGTTVHHVDRNGRPTTGTVRGYDIDDDGDAVVLVEHFYSGQPRLDRVARGNIDYLDQE